jgi:hypothetical protein
MLSTTKIRILTPAGSRMKVRRFRRKMGLSNPIMMSPPRKDITDSITINIKGAATMKVM